MAEPGSSPSRVVPRSSQQDLGAATADVDHHDLIGVGVGERQAAQHREARLLLLPQHVEPEPGDALDAADEVGAVGGPPAGLGGDAAEPRPDAGR